VRLWDLARAQCIRSNKVSRNVVTFVRRVRSDCLLIVHQCVPRNRPISVYGFPRRALTLCPQLCTSMGIQDDARFPARSADALPATLFGHPGDIPKSAYYGIRSNRVSRSLVTLVRWVGPGVTSTADCLFAHCSPAYDYTPSSGE